MNYLWQALEEAKVAWRTWSETNYNTRDESFQAVIFTQSKVQACFDALKDAGTHISNSLPKWPDTGKVGGGP